MLRRVNLECSCCERACFEFYQCSYAASNLGEPDCGKLLCCEGCSIHHKHPCSRIPALGNKIRTAGELRCPYCETPLNGNNYEAHKASCNFRPLSCPLLSCGQQLGWQQIANHLESHHQFVTENVEADYGGYKKVNPPIPIESGVVFRGNGEWFIIFLTKPHLCFLWLGDPRDKPEKFILKVLVDNLDETETLTQYFHPRPSRVSGKLIRLCATPEGTLHVRLRVLIQEEPRN